MASQMQLDRAHGDPLGKALSWAEVAPLGTDRSHALEGIRDIDLVFQFPEPRKSPKLKPLRTHNNQLATPTRSPPSSSENFFFSDVAEPLRSRGSSTSTSSNGSIFASSSNGSSNSITGKGIVNEIGNGNGFGNGNGNGIGIVNGNGIHGNNNNNNNNNIANRDIDRKSSGSSSSGGGSGMAESGFYSAAMSPRGDITPTATSAAVAAAALVVEAAAADLAQTADDDISSSQSLNATLTSASLLAPVAALTATRSACMDVSSTLGDTTLLPRTSAATTSLSTSSLMASSAPAMMQQRTADQIAEMGVPVEFSKKKKKKKFLLTKQETFEDLFELKPLVLGKGATAVVHACEQRSTGAQFAVKIIRTDENNPLIDRDAVFRELDILHKCKGQANILQLERFMESDTCFYFITEKLDGGPLLEHIKAAKSFTEREASMVTLDMSHALQFLHSQGIAHRDIKPQNILCVNKDKASPAKLCDFGLALERTENNTTGSLSAPVGTPEFMPPEVAQAISMGEKLMYDYSCDIWSLGVIVYIMLSGHPPFTGDCGLNCGWKRGSHCERCAENLLDEIQEGKIELEDEDWKPISGAAKDLIRKMLVPANQRITAERLLRQPWVSQRTLAPKTPLYTPNILRQRSNESELDTFASQANQRQREMAEDAVMPLQDPSASRLMRRRSSRNVHPSQFNTVEAQELSEIKASRFNARQGDQRVMEGSHLKNAHRVYLENDDGDLLDSSTMFG